MKKLLTCLILLFTIFVIGLGTSLAASPSELEQQIEQVKNERENLIAEQKKLQAELDLVNKESQTLGTAVKSLDTTKKKLAKDISITQSKITSTNLTIKSLENTMGKKEQQIVIHQKAIATAIQTLSQYDSRSLVLDFLASTQFSDVWRDRSQLEGLSKSLESEINNLRETKRVLSQEKKQKEKVKQEQVSLQGQLSGQKSVVEENQKAKEKLLTETKNKEAEYQRLLKQNIARQKQSETDLSRLESELAVILDPSLFPASKHGILSWPTDKVFVTGYFGRADCNIYPPPTCFHNGVDFRASVGTPIRAMLSGTVVGAGNTDSQKGCYSYGRWILIEHNNGLTSLYTHLSASIVKNNQTVDTGQIIGYSGGMPGASGSGKSTAPHLHIGLFASQGVQIRQFTTSIGCKQVFVPIALGSSSYLDPLDYLPAL